MATSPHPLLRFPALRACAVALALGAVALAPGAAAAPRTAPPALPEATPGVPGIPEAREEDPAVRALQAAAAAVVSVKTRALANARSSRTLGSERSGSGVLIAPSGLVLTIGYLILEADQVEVTDASGRSLPASVVAYDHATGFGLLRPFGPLSAKPARLGASGALEKLDGVLVATAGEGGVSVATVVSRRTFAGYWEYLIDGAIFTTPPRLDHSGAALINKDGEIVGIGSLLVMDAMTPGERLPGNMFVPVDLLKPILGEMIATGKQKGGRRPWIGVNSVEDDGRLKVLRVTEEGPADQAGLQAGDIILAVAGAKVSSLDEFYRRLWSAAEPGAEVAFTVLQGSAVREMRIRCIDRLDFVRRKPTI